MKEEKYTNKYITELLRSIAAVYLLKNENRFKIIAYEKAADSVEHLSRELKDLWQEGKLNKVPGMGASIGANMDEYFKTGTSKHFDEVLAGVPKSVFVLMRIPSIGPKKAYKLVQAFSLLNPDTVVDDLKKVAENNLIADLPSFGKKSQEDIIEAINLYARRDRREDRMPLPYAYALAQESLAYVKKHPAVKRADALGSMRRMVSTIGDIDIAVQVEVTDKTEARKSKVYDEVIAHFLEYPGKIGVENAGDNKASIMAAGNIRVDLRVQEGESYGSMLQYFTGSKAHNIKLREYALKKGLSLSEWGIKKVKDGKVDTDENILKFKTEESFYEYLGLPCVPPEIREGTTEVDLAIKKQLPDLVELKHINGDFHTHSSYDLKPSHDMGANPYEDLVKKAEELGYSYIGFSDHNPKISDTTDAEIIEIMKRRKEYIDELFSKKEKGHIPYFIGLETDIQPSGELALPEKAIDYVDYLIVSVHSSFMMNIEKMTERVLKALSYPKVKILGHPTGRLLGKREGFELDWEKIFAHVKEHNQALEVNSWPQRLDLPDLLVREGKDAGVKFFINTDAHAVSHMDNMFYGVSVARRGWLTKEDVVNTLSYKEMKKWMEK